MIRIPIDPPYADIKTLLLQVVAEASRCRTIFLHNLLMSTVVGAATDIAAIELLFTSLLVQAQTALADTARRAPAGSRPRSQSFRSAFLAAYTDRIAERLEEINQAVFAEAANEKGSGFLPVLRSQSDVIDQWIFDRFGELVSSPIRRSYNGAGWASGRVAANNAQLSFGEVDLRDHASPAAAEAPATLFSELMP